MQIMKAGAVAIGALATVAAMGAPAAAAANHSPAGLSLDKAQAMRAIGAQFLTAREGWDAPWDIEPQATTATLSGSVTNTNAFQACGSTAVNAAGAATATGSPNTVLGDCDNGNSEVTQDDNFPVTGLNNDSVIATLTNQACGSTASFAAGVATALQSPNTVIGDCDNGNVEIGVEEDEDEDKYGYKDWHEENATLEVAKAVALRKGHLATTKSTPVRAGWDVYAADHKSAPVRAGWDLYAADHKSAPVRAGWDSYDDAAHKSAPVRAGWDSYYKADDHKSAPVRAGWDSYDKADGHKSAPVRAGWDSYDKADGHKSAPVRAGWDSYDHKDDKATPVRDSWGGYDDHSAKAAGRSLPAAQRGDDDDEGWDAPWDVDSFGVISTTSGAALLTSTNQACGSTGVFDGGGAISTGSPNTVLGECDNANVDIKKLGPKAATVVGDNSSTNIMPWQLCGSTGSTGAAASAALQSPNTVFGGCSNANTEID